MVVATKGRFAMGEGPNDLGLSRRHLRARSTPRCAGSASSTSTSTRCTPGTPSPRSRRRCASSTTPCAAGKISYYGFSNYLGLAADQGGARRRAHGWAPPVTLQPQYNLLVRDIEHEIVPAALDAGHRPPAVVPARRAAGSPASTERDEPPHGATRLGENPQRGMEAWQRRATPRSARGASSTPCGDVAEAHGVPMSQVALAWLGSRPAVTSVILGARTVEQLPTTWPPTDLDLTDDELTRLTDASAPIVDDYPYGDAGVAQRHRRLTGGR